MTLKNDLDNVQHQFDLKMMKKALLLARQSELNGEVPIAAIVVDKDGKIISKSMNTRQAQTTVLGHAELIALHRACKKRHSWRLADCTLYVTLEPCFMCAGALVQSRIARVVFAAQDPKGGALGSLANLANHDKLNHKFEVKSGLLANESSELLRSFFKKKRRR